ncbi:MAG: 4Fe-4S dicluster domain-containing protein [Gammaproteobacteria bacterium]|nr:4Fe-4S dicluster domain-containing protein [Gammaproteobacteria bacterium]
MSNKIDQYRRTFLGASGVTLAGLTVAPGVLLNSAQAKSKDQAISSSNRWGLLIDTNKCNDGCTKCVTACNEEHGLRPNHGPETDSQWIRKVTLKNKSTGHVVNMPMMCQHCENPPCVDVCPTGASFKRDDGIVLVDKHICIGCRYCMMACPYKARNFIHETLTDQLPVAPRGKGTVESCTMCMHKVDNGDGSTVCADACPEKAITFGDLKDPSSPISKELAKHGGRQLRAELGLNTAVRYQGL